MASGTIVKNVVEYIVNQIVEDTKSVKVDVADSDDENVTIEVRTSPDDMGRVIGKRGRVARAIRTVAQAAADEEGLQSCLLYTSPSPRDLSTSRMPSSA